MNWSPQSMMLATACLLALGCNPKPQQFHRPDEPHRFLGIAEDETSNEGPVGLIDGRSIQVSNVSKVQEVPLLEYKKAIKESKVVAEEIDNGFVYWAIKTDRDVRFENASAWVTVLERYKSPLE